MPQLKKDWIEDRGYVYSTKEPFILNLPRRITSIPGREERRLLGSERYIEAILLTALRLENYLKEIFFREGSKHTYGTRYEIFDMNFAKILNLCRVFEFISLNQYKKINAIKKARNEIAHHPESKNDYVDRDKTKGIVEAGITIINELHQKLVALQESNNT